MAPPHGLMCAAHVASRARPEALPEEMEVAISIHHPVGVTDISSSLAATYISALYY